MALIITITKGAGNPNRMDAKAGEAIHFSYQLVDTAHDVMSLAGRELVFALYSVAAGKRTEIGYFDAVHTTDARGECLLWEIDGAATESYYGRTLKWEISERGLIGRETILQGVFTVGESAPRIDNLSTAPRGRYISRIVHTYNPASVSTPDFVTFTEPYAGSITPPEPPVEGAGVITFDFSDEDGFPAWAFA